MDGMTLRESYKNRFHWMAWSLVTRALTEKDCETFGEALQIIKDFCIKCYGDEAETKMREYGIGTVKDVKDLISLLGEQGWAQFDSLNDSPEARLWNQGA